MIQNDILYIIRINWQALISDSTPVELTGRVQVLENGDLLISNVRESDAGWYNCIRSNEAGSVTGQAYLGVMGMHAISEFFDEKRLKRWQFVQNVYFVFFSL